MKYPIRLFVYAILALGLTLGGCQLSSKDGSVSLSLTDAPTDALNVDGVWITINQIQYHSGDSWVTVAGFEPETYNLLDLTGGVTAPLADFTLPAGKVSQIRFILDAPTQGGGSPTNPGCWISFNDETEDAPLFIPSGGQSGVKLTGAFDVPINGSVNIVADFDARKSVVVTGGAGADPRYILKPTIRLIVEDQAGRISGTATGLEEDYTYAVYAYEDGSWEASEINEDPSGTVDSPGIRFPNAVTSYTLADTDADGNADAASGTDSSEGNPGYVLAFLAAGDYQVVVARTGSLGVVEAALAGTVTVDAKGSENLVLDVTSIFASANDSPRGWQNHLATPDCNAVARKATGIKPVAFRLSSLEQYCGITPSGKITVPVRVALPPADYPVAKAQVGPGKLGLLHRPGNIFRNQKHPGRAFGTPVPEHLAGVGGVMAGAEQARIGKTGRSMVHQMNLPAPLVIYNCKYIFQRG